MKSLIICGVPKSCTSVLYNTLSRYLPLASPSYTTNGEFYNFQRHVGIPYDYSKESHFYEAGDSDMDYEMAGNVDDPYLARVELMDHMIQREGYLYKSVVQPFVFSTWKKENPHDVNALYIDRPLEQVIFRHVRDDRLHLNGMDGHVRKIYRAKKRLKSLNIPRLTYSDFINDEASLNDLIEKFYPSVHDERGEIEYMTDAFARRKENVLSQREDDFYNKVKKKVHGVI